MTAGQRGVRSEAGFLTIWLLGLCLLLLFVGGVSADLWHVFAERQALAGIADAAALAGASGIDPNEARAGVILLDPARATALAEASVAAQPDAGSLVSSSVGVSVAGSEIMVSMRGTSSLFLLRLLGAGPLVFHVTASAVARSAS